MTVEKDLGLEGMSDPERRQTESLIRLMHGMMTRRDAAPVDGVHVQKRDVHMKMHGLLRAEFTVPADLPAELRVGLFARPGTYRAWVRLSNSASFQYPDRKGDIRGLAIKVMGVPGRKVLAAEAEAGTHDFLVVTAPNFPAGNAAQTQALVEAVLGNLFVKLRWALTHPWGAWIVATTMVRHANLLQETYHSVVPYRFGDQAVKYMALPQQPLTDGLPARPTPRFLRERLVADLARGDAGFDFCVQFQRDADCMPIEDPRPRWSERLSPPRRVATLRLLQQDFDTDERRSCGENLAFTPWHCLPAHEPLGILNRARRAVYETLSTYRREVNHATLVEPDDWAC